MPSYGILDLLALGAAGGVTAVGLYTPITYPLDLPNTHLLRQTFGMRSVVAVSRSPFTLKSQIQEHMGQMWVADATLPALGRVDAEPWIVWLLKLNGQLGTFLLGEVGQGKTPQGIGAGVPVVDGAGQAGQRITTRGWSTAPGFVLKAGDWFQLGQRLHKTLVDVSGDGTGRATVDFWPRLRESPADGTAIITQAPRGLFRLAGNDAVVVSVDKSKVYDISFSAVEAF